MLGQLGAAATMRFVVDRYCSNSRQDPSIPRGSQFSRRTPREDASDAFPMNGQGSSASEELLALLASLAVIPPEVSMTKRLSFVENPAWEVGPLKDFTVFFSNLDMILPEDAVLFLEGTSMAQDVKDFLASCALPEPENLELGEGYLGDRLPKERTFKVPFGGELKIFPRGSRFHIAVSPDNLKRLAELSGQHAEPEIFDSLLAYRAEKALLHWYDPPSDPFNVSTEIDEARLKSFCEKAQIGYRTVC